MRRGAARQVERAGLAVAATAARRCGRGGRGLLCARLGGRSVPPVPRLGVRCQPRYSQRYARDQLGEVVELKA